MHRVERHVAVGLAQARAGHADLAVLTLGSVLERAPHGPLGASSFGGWLGHVIGVGTHTHPGQFAINTRATCRGVLVRFQDQDARALAEHETITVTVPRATGGFR